MKKIYEDVEIGKVYGDWTVINKGNGKLVGDGKDKKIKKKTWECQCSCGYCNQVIRDVLDDNLRKGKSNGCGNKGRYKNGKNNKKYNTYVLNGEYGIGFTEDKYEFYFDIEDHDKIKEFCWHKHQDGYLRTRIDVVEGKNKYILMHNLIIGYRDSTGKYNVDHINNKQFDNRKENLRICTHADNMKNVKTNSRNISGYKGVHFSKIEKKWKVYITVNENKINLGTYVDKNEAIEVRKTAEIKYFKEFSREHGESVVSITN